MAAVPRLPACPHAAPGHRPGPTRPPSARRGRGRRRGLAVAGLLAGLGWGAGRSDAEIRPGAEAAAVAPDGAPAALTHWRLDYTSALLWKFTGSATPLSYTLAPQIVSLVGPRVGTLRPLAGGRLALRSRFSALVEPIVHGPEHHYIGGTASGLLEWWDRTFQRCLCFSAGGGVGWLASASPGRRGRISTSTGSPPPAAAGRRRVVSPRAREFTSSTSPTPA